MFVSATRPVVILFSLLFVSSYAFADDKEQIDRFVKGWRNWRDRTGNAEIVLSKVSRGVNTTNKALTENAEWHLRQKGILWRGDRTKLDSTGKRQIVSWVLGATESFALTSRNEVGPWTVRQMAKADDQSFKESIPDGRALVEMPWSVTGLDLAVATSKASFKIKKISPAKSPYGDSWEIDFTYQPVDPKSTALRGGKMLIEKDVDFGIVRGDFQTDWGSVVVENVFAVKPDGPVLLSGKQSVLTKENSGFVTEYNLKRAELANKLSDDVFTLSAFGLTDRK